MSRSISVSRIIRTGDIFLARSNLCQYTASLDFAGGLITVSGPGISRSFPLDEEPFATILEARDSEPQDLVLAAVLFLEINLPEPT